MFGRKSSNGCFLATAGLLLIVVVIFGLYTFISGLVGKSGTPTVSMTTITLNQIKQTAKLQTAEITGQTTVSYTEKKRFYRDVTLIYQVTVTMTAGVNLQEMKDSDIKDQGDTLYITLPPAQVQNINTSFEPLAETKQLVARLTGTNASLEAPKEIVAQGQNQIQQNVLKEGKLLREAQSNAQTQLRTLVNSLMPGRYREIRFNEIPITGTPHVQ